VGERAGYAEQQVSVLDAPWDATSHWGFRTCTGALWSILTRRPFGVLVDARYYAFAGSLHSVWRRIWLGKGQRDDERARL